MVDLNNKHLCNQEKTGDDGFDSERKRNQLKFTKDDGYLKESYRTSKYRYILIFFHFGQQQYNKQVCLTLG